MDSKCRFGLVAEPEFLLSGGYGAELTLQLGPGGPLRAPGMRGAQAWAGPRGATLDLIEPCLQQN